MRSRKRDENGEKCIAGPPVYATQVFDIGPTANFAAKDGINKLKLFRTNSRCFSRRSCDSLELDRWIEQFEWAKKADERENDNYWEQEMKKNLDENRFEIHSIHHGKANEAKKWNRKANWISKIQSQRRRSTRCDRRKSSKNDQPSKKKMKKKSKLENGDDKESIKFRRLSKMNFPFNFRREECSDSSMASYPIDVSSSLPFSNMFSDASRCAQCTHYIRIAMIALDHWLDEWHRMASPSNM